MHWFVCSVIQLETVRTFTTRGQHMESRATVSPVYTTVLVLCVITRVVVLQNGPENNNKQSEDPYSQSNGAGNETGER